MHHSEYKAVEKSAVLKLAQIIVQRQGGILTDGEALTAPECFETWAADRPYGEGQVIRHEDTLYRVMTAVVQSEAHRPPGSEGMLAVYRPIVREHSGTVADPIPFAYGMDTAEGKYYSYENKLYLCVADMIPCVWPPDSGIWQWSEVN